jgi:hypothetical protein
MRAASDVAVVRVPEEDNKQADNDDQDGAGIHPPQVRLNLGEAWYLVTI